MKSDIPSIMYETVFRVEVAVVDMTIRTRTICSGAYSHGITEGSRCI